MKKWTAEGEQFSILLMDIDRFKAVNDYYGHQTGDELIKHVAKILTSSTGPDDVYSRFGGEEFVVLLPRSNMADTFKVAERIRITLESKKSPTGKPVTVSIGISKWLSSSDSPADLLHIADMALYKAKNEGRNKTVIVDQKEMQAI